MRRPQQCERRQAQSGHMRSRWVLGMSYAGPGEPGGLVVIKESGQCLILKAEPAGLCQIRVLT